MKIKTNFKDNRAFSDFPLFETNISFQIFPITIRLNTPSFSFYDFNFAYAISFTPNKFLIFFNIIRKGGAKKMKISKNLPKIIQFKKETYLLEIDKDTIHLHPHLSYSDFYICILNQQVLLDSLNIFEFPNLIIQLEKEVKK